MIDEALIRKLSRQVKILNIFLVFFSLVFLATLVLVGLVGYQALQEVRDAKNTLNSLQTSATQNLDLKNQLCASDGTLKTLLTAQSNICD